MDTLTPPDAPARATTGTSTGTSTGDRAPSARGARGTTHRWARLLHVYTSMIALVIVLFFGITGITLNHPDWTFGDEVNTTTISGALPVDTTLDDGSVDFLSVSEYVRDEYDVSGSVDSFDVVNGQGSIAYKNPGYSADLFFDVETGEFDLTIEQQGWVAVINDLHKGRDTGTLWKWVIDLAAGFLVVISLTGLVMQFFLRKRRRSALISAAVGGLIVIVLVAITLA
jgi:hypothetical protein